MTDDEETPHFNVFVDNWILAIYQDGCSREVSIDTLLRDSYDIREIGGDSKQQALPVIRFTLAILLRSLSKRGMTSEDELLDYWEKTWRAHAFDMDAIHAYVDPLLDRFDLFDKAHPLFQVSGLEYADKAPDGIGELVADIPKDDKFLFSLRNRNRLEDLSFAEAARWLVFQQAYATAGIKTPVKGNTHVQKGKVYPPKGAVGTGMLGSVPRGAEPVRDADAQLGPDGRHSWRNPHRGLRGGHPGLGEGCDLERLSRPRPGRAAWPRAMLHLGEQAHSTGPRRRKDARHRRG